MPCGCLEFNQPVWIIGFSFSALSRLTWKATISTTAFAISTTMLMKRHLCPCLFIPHIPSLCPLFVQQFSPPQIFISIFSPQTIPPWCHFSLCSSIMVSHHSSPSSRFISVITLPCLDSSLHQCRRPNMRLW